MMFSWLGELMSVFWLMELDLVSLKGSAVFNSKFWGVYRFSMSLGSPSGFGSLDTSISTVASNFPCQHIFTAARHLLVPGIIAGASVPLSHC